jgi:hypothetical protein
MSEAIRCRQRRLTASGATSFHANDDAVEEIPNWCADGKE